LIVETRAFWNRLYRQNKDGSLTDVTEAAGLSNAGAGNYGMGVAVGDYDNDGYPDLFVTSYGKNILYHNNGDGTFTDVTAKAGVAGGGWSASAGFFDSDNDGHLDLFVTRYMEWDTKHSKTCGGAWQTYCPPGEFPQRLTFSIAIAATARSKTLARNPASPPRRAAPWEWPSPTMTTTASQTSLSPTMVCSNTLYHNNGNGTFTECAFESGAALSADGKPLSGMGTVFQDYDNDSKPDIIVTELPREIYGL